MPAAAQPLDRLKRALDQAAGVVAGVEDSDLDRATPCRSWDVRTVTNHLINNVSNFALAAAGEWPDYTAQAPDIRGERSAAFRANADKLLDAWRSSDDMDRTMKLPMGEVPASFVVNQQISELAVHAWDIATATGQKVDWDEGVATGALTWAKQSLKPEFRGEEGSGKVFGTEVQPSPGASAQEKLVAFFGRDVA